LTQYKNFLIKDKNLLIKEKYLPIKDKLVILSGKGKPLYKDFKMVPKSKCVT